MNSEQYKSLAKLFQNSSKEEENEKHRFLKNIRELKKLLNKITTVEEIKEPRKNFFGKPLSDHKIITDEKKLLNEINSKYEATKENIELILKNEEHEIESMRNILFEINKEYHEPLSKEKELKEEYKKYTYLLNELKQEDKTLDQTYKPFHKTFFELKDILEHKHIKDENNINEQITIKIQDKETINNINTLITIIEKDVRRVIEAIKHIKEGTKITNIFKLEIKEFEESKRGEEQEISKITAEENSIISGTNELLVTHIVIITDKMLENYLDRHISATNYGEYHNGKPKSTFIKEKNVRKLITVEEGIRILNEITMKIIMNNTIEQGDKDYRIPAEILNGTQGTTYNKIRGTIQPTPNAIIIYQIKMNLELERLSVKKFSKYFESYYHETKHADEIKKIKQIYNDQKEHKNTVKIWHIKHATPKF